MCPTNADIQQARETLIRAFAAALSVPESPDLESAEYRRIPQWDSVAHMRLVAEIEMAFEIMLDTDDVIGMNSFRKAAEVLAKHGIHTVA
jgi:acyl carrier protein